MRWRRWLGPALVLGGLLPTAAVAWQAATVGDSVAQTTRPLTKRERILAKIATDPAVLINVGYADLPASPDILNLGKRSTKALERCLSDNVDPNARSLCAVVLEALGDQRALPTLRSALDDWEPDVRLRVVNALAAMPHPDNVAPLLKLYERTDEEQYVRSAALHALGAVSDKRVVRKLRDDLSKESEDDEQDYRAEVFEALWRNRHLMARTTIIADTRSALGSDNHGLVLHATYGAAELRSPQLVQALLPLMEHPNPEIRNKAVYALGRIGDKTATKALLAQLPKVRESRMLNNIAFALERLDKKAFYASIKDVAEHKQAIIRLNAAFVLGDVRHAEGLPLLEKSLGDASDFVRTSAIVAVGKLGMTGDDQTKRATAMLEPFVDHSNLSVRQEAIYALHELTKGGRKDLIHDKLFAKVDGRAYPNVVRRAALALGDAGDKRASSYLIQCMLRGPCGVSQVGPFVQKFGSDLDRGRVLLGWARRDARLSPLVALMKPAGTLPIASSALQEDWPYPRSPMTAASLNVLGALGDPSVSDLLQRRATSDDSWARIRSNVALARLGNDAAMTKLTADMDNLAAEWLPEMVRTMALIQEKPAIDALDPAMEQKQASKDAQLALAAAAVRLAWKPEQAVFRFLDALASPSGFERDLAERYLTRAKARKVTWLLRRMLAREGREDVRDRLRAILDERG